MTRFVLELTSTLVVTANVGIVLVAVLQAVDGTVLVAVT